MVDDKFIFVGFYLPMILLVVVVVGVTALIALVENPVLKGFCPDDFSRKAEYGFLQVTKEEYFCKGNEFTCNFSEKKCYYLQEGMN